MKIDQDPRIQRNLAAIRGIIVDQIPDSVLAENPDGMADHEFGETGVRIWREIGNVGLRYQHTAEEDLERDDFGPIASSLEFDDGLSKVKAKIHVAGGEGQEFDRTVREAQRVGFIASMLGHLEEVL